MAELTWAEWTASREATSAWLAAQGAARISNVLVEFASSRRSDDNTRARVFGVIRASLPEFAPVLISEPLDGVKLALRVLTDASAGTGEEVRAEAGALLHAIATPLPAVHAGAARSTAVDADDSDGSVGVHAEIVRQVQPAHLEALVRRLWQVDAVSLCVAVVADDGPLSSSDVRATAALVVTEVVLHPLLKNEAQAPPDRFAEAGGVAALHNLMRGRDELFLCGRVAATCLRRLVVGGTAAIRQSVQGADVGAAVLGIIRRAGTETLEGMPGLAALEAARLMHELARWPRLRGSLSHAGALPVSMSLLHSKGVHAPAARKIAEETLGLLARGDPYSSRHHNWADFFQALMEKSFAALQSARTLVGLGASRAGRRRMLAMHVENQLWGALSTDEQHMVAVKTDVARLLWRLGMERPVFDVAAEARALEAADDSAAAAGETEDRAPTGSAAGGSKCDAPTQSETEEADPNRWGNLGPLRAVAHELQHAHEAEGDVEDGADDEVLALDLPFFAEDDAVIFFAAAAVAEGLARYHAYHNGATEPESDSEELAEEDDEPSIVAQLRARRRKRMKEIETMNPVQAALAAKAVADERDRIASLRREQESIPAATLRAARLFVRACVHLLEASHARRVEQRQDEEDIVRTGGTTIAGGASVAGSNFTGGAGGAGGHASRALSVTGSVASVTTTVVSMAGGQTDAAAAGQGMGITWNKSQLSRLVWLSRCPYAEVAALAALGVRDAIERAGSDRQRRVWRLELLSFDARESLRAAHGSCVGGDAELATSLAKVVLATRSRVARETALARSSTGVDSPTRVAHPKLHSRARRLDALADAVSDADAADWPHALVNEALLALGLGERTDADAGAAASASSRSLLGSFGRDTGAVTEQSNPLVAALPKPELTEEERVMAEVAAVAAKPKPKPRTNKRGEVTAMNPLAVNPLMHLPKD